ncbi:MAG: DedA family protein [Candidatus Eremiobacteraeota bacterium]|nr:DedA family protein [Candidatus Eremiobacteraeota bacterium]MBV9737846.1 DedA family protein [Candidatus Eremiobacteraeota bacterium]
MQQLSAALLALVDHAGYFGLLLTMAIGNIGVPVGSEIILPAAGALVATGHLHSLAATIAVAVLGELLGGTVGYAIGRYGGRAFVHRYGHYVLFHEAEMVRVEAFFTRYGSFAIFLCRFIPVLRGIVAIPAGIARMALVPFYLWTALGSLGFCAALIYVGHTLGKNFGVIVPALHRFSLLIIILLVVVIVLYFILRRRAAARNEI